MVETRNPAIPPPYPSKRLSGGEIFHLVLGSLSGLTAIALMIYVLIME